MSINRYIQTKNPSQSDKVKAASEFSGVPSYRLKKSPGLLVKLLDILDRPGNATRALLVGKLGGLKGLIPFAQTIENLTGWDIALNEDELVRGKEVLEQWTGMKDTKGKFDITDVLGFLIEVVADPLWLVGGAGALTKTGRAAKTVRSAVKSAKAISGARRVARGIKSAAKASTIAKSQADDILRASLKGRVTKDTIHQISKHFKTGALLPADTSKRLVSAFETLYAAGGGKIPVGALKAKTWAEGAVRGERALLSLGLPRMRKPVIKGVGVLRKFDTISTKVRKGWIGEKFLSGGKRVKTEHLDDFHALLRKHGADIPAYELRRYDEMIRKAYNIEKANAIPEGIVADYVEATLGKTKAVNKLNELDDVWALAKNSVETKEIALLHGFDPNINIFKQINAKRNSLRADIDVLAGMSKKVSTGTDTGILDEIAKIYTDMNEDFLYQGLARGAPEKELAGKFGYFPRIVSEKAGKWLNKNTPLKGFTFKHKGRTFTLKHGFQRTRNPILRDMTRDEVGELFKTKGFIGDFYEKSAAVSMAKRTSKHTKMTGSAEAVLESIKRFGNTAGDGTPISLIKKRLGFRDDYDIARQLGFIEEIDVKGVKKIVSKKIFIDDDIAKALAEQYTISQTTDFASTMKKINGWYKTYFTVFWPAYHGRNALSNVALNYMAGVKNPLSYHKALKLQWAARNTRKIMKKTGQTWDEAAKTIKWDKIKTAAGAMDGSDFYKLMDKQNLLGQTAGHFGVEEIPLKGYAGVKSRAGKVATEISPSGKAAGFGFKSGQAVENNARIAHAIEKATSGIDDAVLSAKKALFDYADLSTFEKTVLRDNTFLFYTFARKNLEANVRNLTQVPAKMAMYSHLAGGTPTMQTKAKEWPSYMQERINVSTPFRDKNDRKIMLRGLGLPIEEAFGTIAGPGVGLFEQWKRRASRMLGRLQPVPKIAIELGTGRNLYFDQEIQSIPDWMMSSTPGARVGGTAKMFAGAGTPTGKALQYLTGIKYSPEYTDYYKFLAEKEASQQYLKHRKGIKSFTKYYTPKPKRPEISNENELVGTARYK